MGARGPLPRSASGQGELTLMAMDGAPITPPPLPPLPPPAPWLGAVAKAEYERVSEMLGARLTSADYGLLCSYAQAYEEIALHSAELPREGYYFPGTRGAVANPRLRALETARKTLMDCANALGLTPASRQRIQSIRPAPGGSGPGSGAPSIGALPNLLLDGEWSSGTGLQIDSA